MVRRPRDDMDAFFSERLGTVEHALAVVEGTRGMNLQRIATLEHRTAGIVDTLSRLESRVGMGFTREKNG